MTEEEKLAKEYVANKADKGNFDLEQFGKAYFSESSMECAFLAGLKARKPKWHKVADKDLPKDSNDVIVYLDDGLVTMDYYVKDYADWRNYPNSVVAWCEIPKFEEE